mgnify:CR=1 FL=1
MEGYLWEVTYEQSGASGVSRRLRKVLEIAEVSRKSLRQTSDDLLRIAFERMWVGEVVKKDDGTRHRVIFTKLSKEGRSAELNRMP